MVVKLELQSCSEYVNFVNINKKINLCKYVNLLSLN